MIDENRAAARKVALANRLEAEAAEALTSGEVQAYMLVWVGKDGVIGPSRIRGCSLGEDGPLLVKAAENWFHYLRGEQPAPRFIAGDESLGMPSVEFGKAVSA